MSLVRRTEGDPALTTFAVAAHEDKRRAIRSTRLGLGTLACSRCDAPIGIGARPLFLADPLMCPFCHNKGAVRDFLSLEPPSRPARVVVRIRATVRRAEQV